MTHILVVEDETSFSDALSFMLRKEGFEVEVVDDGKAAIDAFNNRGADLILLDLMLPGMQGTDVCKHIRAYSNVPIIMVTALTDRESRLAGFEAQAPRTAGMAQHPCQQEREQPGHHQLILTRM